MSRVIFITFWSAFVSLISAYATISNVGGRALQLQSHTAPELNVVKLKRLTVPVVGSGFVQGYLLADIGLVVSADEYKKLPEPRELLLSDGAFKVLYNVEAPNFAKMQKQDLDKIGAKLVEALNTRFGTGLVRETIFEGINYVTRADIRSGR
jgi:hypothetical protein